MNRTPMHNRFVEGFSESRSSGETIDPLSFKILDAASGALYRAREARDAELARLLSAGASWLGRTTARIVLGGVAAVRAWRQRERDAAELYALDDHALAELGVSRAEIPFILAHGPYERDSRGLDDLPPVPANHNHCRKDAA
jgi:uncharacterized protein YjiS (DUF1127 family)